MTMLYILMAMLSASVVIKLAQPLLHPGAGGAPTRRQDRATALAVIIVLPLLALVIYHFLGRPEMKGAPVLGLEYQKVAERNAASLALRPMQRLLSENGEDVGALISMGQINYRMGKLDAAVPYYRKAAELAEAQKDFRYFPLLKVVGEVMVEAAGGTVTPEAKEIFEKVLVIHAENPIAHYYLALYQAQQGQREEALLVWRRLLSEGPNTIYWKQRVRDSISATREELRLEAQKITPQE